MQMTGVADGVWVDSAPVGIIGMRLTSTMTVLRLGGDRLLLHSPLAMTPERRAAVQDLGRVEHLYAPNTQHHMWIGEWADSFPTARVHAPAGLAKKRPELRVDRVIDAATPESDFAGVVDEIRIDGFRLEESVLVHRPTRTLVVADLVHNVGRPTHGWTVAYTRMMGFYDRVALSRMIRWIGFSDRAAARAAIDAVLACPLERIVVGHGSPVTARARDALAAAYAWLPATVGSRP
jgi:uncharacterized protein DUF4336